MKLKEIRKKFGFTQKQVAEKLDIPISTYNGYENEMFQPTVSTLIKLANFYNLSIDELVGREHQNYIDKGTLNDLEINIIEKIILLDRDNLIRLQSYTYALWQNQLDEQEIDKKIKGGK